MRAGSPAGPVEMQERGLGLILSESLLALPPRPAHPLVQLTWMAAVNSAASRAQACTESSAGGPRRMLVGSIRQPELNAARPPPVGRRLRCGRSTPPRAPAGTPRGRRWRAGGTAAYTCDDEGQEGSGCWWERAVLCRHFERTHTRAGWGFCVASAMASQSMRPTRRPPSAARR